MCIRDRIITEERSWKEIGLPELYGNVSIDTTDPAKSNSGNMFAGLLANTLNGGVTAVSYTHLFQGGDLLGRRIR